MLLEPCTQSRCINSPCALCDNCSLAKQHQGWNAPDLIACSQLLLRFRVDLEETELRLDVSRNTLIGGSHGLAGGAPFRPEVGDHRNIIPLNMHLKALSRDWVGMPVKEKLMTMAAFRVTCLSLHRNSIDAGTVWTDDVLRFCAHDFVSIPRAIVTPCRFATCW